MMCCCRCCRCCLNQSHQEVTTVTRSTTIEQRHEEEEHIVSEVNGEHLYPPGRIVHVVRNHLESKGYLFIS